MDMNSSTEYNEQYSPQSQSSIQYNKSSESYCSNLAYHEGTTSQEEEIIIMTPDSNSKYQYSPQSQSIIQSNKSGESYYSNYEATSQEEVGEDNSSRSGSCSEYYDDGSISRSSSSSSMAANGWFREFDLDHGSAILEQQGERDNFNFVHYLLNQLSALQKTPRGVLNYNWDRLELAAYRDPIGVAEYRIPGAKRKRRAIWLLVQYPHTPLSVLHCFLRADPDAVLNDGNHEIVEEEEEHEEEERSHHSDNESHLGSHASSSRTSRHRNSIPHYNNNAHTPILLPLHQACYSGCSPSFVGHLLRATIFCFLHYGLDWTPLDFLLEERSQDEEQCLVENFALLPLLLQQMALPPTLPHFSACHFVLQWMTRPGRIHPCLLMFPEESLTKLFAELLPWDANNLNSLLAEDDFFFHKLFHREWPLCLSGCSLLVEGLLANYEYTSRLQQPSPLLLEDEDHDGDDNQYSSSAQVNNTYSNRLPLHLAIDHVWPYSCLEQLLQCHPNALRQRDLLTGLYPFQMAAACFSGSRNNRVETCVWAIMKGSEPERLDLFKLDTCYRLLRTDPTTLLLCSSMEGKKEEEPQIIPNLLDE